MNCHQTFTYIYSYISQISMLIDLCLYSLTKFPHCTRCITESTETHKVNLRKLDICKILKRYVVPPPIRKSCLLHYFYQFWNLFCVTSGAERIWEGKCIWCVVVCILNERRAQYHPGVWAARRWSCCDAEKRAAPGCALAAVWPLPEPPLEVLTHRPEPRPVSDVTCMYPP